MATASSIPPLTSKESPSNRSWAIWQQNPDQLQSMLCLATTLSYASVSPSVKGCFLLKKKGGGRLLSFCEKE